MATWQRYDGLETRASRAGAEIADFMAYLRDYFPAVHIDHGDGIMAAAQELTDAMRNARHDAQRDLIIEKGHRR